MLRCVEEPERTIGVDVVFLRFAVADCPLSVVHSAGSALGSSCDHLARPSLCRLPCSLTSLAQEGVPLSSPRILRGHDAYAECKDLLPWSNSKIMRRCIKPLAVGNVRENLGHTVRKNSSVLTTTSQK